MFYFSYVQSTPTALLSPVLEFSHQEEEEPKREREETTRRRK